LLQGGKIGQVVACAADVHGNVYLANLDRGPVHLVGKPFKGSIVKVTPKLHTTYVAKDLNYPTGMTLGPDGNLYVTLNGLCPSKLSLITTHNAPPHACPAPGAIVRVKLGSARGT
jgi:hypothetical protein